MTAVLPSCVIPRIMRGDDVRLAYGELADGTIVHVNQVESGLACDCICPGCRARLVARKGALKEHHFGHYRSAPCSQALESALHKLAKQVLDERRELLLPEVRAEIGDQELVTHRQEVHRFDDAVLEHHLDTIVPDVIVRKGEHRLLVEMFVTHRCGPEKISRIRELDIACLEIDLRKLPRGATREAVAQALLGQARRTWLHNPKIVIATQKLEEQMARQQEEARLAAERASERERQRLEALARRIVRLQSETKPHRKRDSKLVDEVRALGFEETIGLQLTGDFAFAVLPCEWQALIMERFVIKPLEERMSAHSGFSASTVFTELRKRNLLRPAMPTYFNAEAEAFLARTIPGFRAPYRVVEDYLAQLEFQGILRSYRKTWMVHDDVQRRWEDKRRRRWELGNHERLIRGTLSAILGAVPPDERKAFSAERWWRTPHPDHGISFEEAFRQDDRRLTEISFILYQIEAMLLRHGKIVTDLFDLPVAAQSRRIIEARAHKAEEARLAAIAREERARADRTARLADAARTALGPEAHAWLNTSIATDNQSPRMRADASENGLYEALDQLRRAETAYRMRLRQEALRDKLLKLADATRRPAHARLFLTSPHPQWANRHPIVACVDEASFERLRRAMAEVSR